MNELQKDVDGRTLVLTINRPEARNSLTRPLLEELAASLVDAARSAEVRCVVLTGARGHFCAGADLRMMGEDPNFASSLDAYMKAFHAVIEGVVHCPKPVIAAMDGCAVGFGADLTLACDLRVATKAAYIQEKFVHLGLMPDGGGTFWLPRLLGTARAMKAMLLGERIDAAELDSLGVLAALVPQDELLARTMQFARKFEKGPPLAYAAMKQAVHASWGDVSEALRREREGQIRLLQTQDLAEGVLAWAQKRDPDFKGS